MMCIDRRRLLATTFSASILAPHLAFAQGYPNRPITFNSVFAPGSPQDLVVRALADIAAKELGQPIITESKPGAGATLAAASMQASKPDGYMIANAVSNIVLLPQLQKVAFDPMRDFTYFAGNAIGCSIIIVLTLAKRIHRANAGAAIAGGSRSVSNAAVVR